MTLQDGPRYGGRGGTGRRLTELDESTAVAKKDWMNIEEHKRRSRDSRRAKSTGAMLATGGTALLGVALTRRPRALKELGELKDVARGRVVPLRPGEKEHAFRVKNGVMAPSAGQRFDNTINAARVRPYGTTLGVGGGLTGVGAGTYAAGRINEGRHDRAIARQRRERAVSKARSYDPEHRRQRRIGMGEAALLMGGGILGFRGAKGIAGSTKLARSVSGVTAKDKDQLKLLEPALRRGITARRSDLAQLGGGAAAVTGAGALRQHAETRRGRAYN